MRESGFDITNRFGPFSADVIHYAPVCLNGAALPDGAGHDPDVSNPGLAVGKRKIWQARGQHRQQLN